MTSPARTLLPAAAASLATALLCGIEARIEAPFAWIGFFGVAPAIAYLDAARSPRDALARGLVICIAFTLAVFAWFADAMAAYAGIAPAVAWLILAATAPLLQPQWLVFALVRYLARARSGASGARAAAIATCAYLGCEWAYPKLLGDGLAHGLWSSLHLRQAADLAGATGIGLALLVANEGVVAGVRGLLQRRWHAAALAAAVAIAPALLLVGYGSWRLASLPDPVRTVRIGLVQADLGNYDALREELGSYAAVRRILDTHFAISRELLARDVELLVWPETVYPTTFGSPKSEDGRALDAEIAEFVARSGVPLIFGAYDAAPEGEFNAAVYLEPTASSAGDVAWDSYRKASLFPLTERVPAWLDGPVLRSWMPWLGTWRAGAEGGRVVSLRLPGGGSIETAPLICYDAVDAAHARRAVRAGAELLVTLSNDAWFQDGRGARLHLAVSGFRTLETRRPQVRATPTGVSAILDARGEALAEAGFHERTGLVADVPILPTVPTLSLRYGDWLGPVLLAAGAGLWLSRARAANRRG